MKRLLFFLTMFSLICGACSQATIEKVGEGDQSNNGSETENNPDANDQTMTYKIGDKVIYNDLEITLVNARVIDDEYMQPNNDQYVAVELEIVNNRDSSAHISTLMNMSFIANGYEMEHAMVSGKGSLDAQISAGRSIKGEVVFDVEKADEYEFIFEDGFSSGQAIWKITNAEIDELS